MSSLTKQISISMLISYTLSIGAWYLYKYYRKIKTNEIPQKWKQIGTVDKIILYPLKSAALKEVTSAECNELGLREVKKNSISNSKHLFQDRSFVIYNAHNNKAIRLIQQPSVTLISIDSVDLDHIVLKAPGIEDLCLTLSEISTGNHVKVTHCGVIYDTIDSGDEAATWLSKFFTNEKGIYRLGYYNEKVNQRPDPIGTTLKVEGFSSIYKHWRKTDGGIYSDLTSYMILSSASIEDANRRLSPEDSFFYGNLRPNIIVKGCEKYAEDGWKWIKIGEKIVMRAIKPCTRCAFITVNPSTGVTNKNMEPLRTLKTYRTIKQLLGLDLEGDLAAFGMYFGLYEPGKIHIDDPVYINV